jgi:hypothetical protein
MPRQTDRARDDQVVRLRAALRIVEEYAPTCAEKIAIVQSLAALIATLARRDLRFCLRCGQPFTWTEQEQGFFARMDYAPPKFCRPCRTARKSERAQFRGPIAAE